ncbi:MAG: VTT domain-containing protein [Patescibacteria group bacterium]
MITGPEEAIKQLGALSYGGIWVVSFLANIVIPIPEEIILLALGYLSGTGSINGWLVMPIVFSALIINDIILYSLSKRGSKFTDFLYKTFFAKRLEKKGTHWLEMNLGKIVFLSRFLIQLRFIGPFLAGTRGLPIKKFILYDAAALLIYTPLFIGLGWYFHTRVMSIIKEVGVVKNLVLLVVGLVVVFLLAKFAYKSIFKRVDL